VLNCKDCVGRVLWVGFMLCGIREIRLRARQLGILRLDNEDHTLLPPEPQPLASIQTQTNTERQSRRDMT
jgi:hypothetical protein